MKCKMFALATVGLVIGILMLFCHCDTWRGIGMSIIAAYMFYILIELVPSIIRDWETLPAKAMAYRRLQILLVKLDDIFVSAYMKAMNCQDGHPEQRMKLHEFYDPSFMVTFMNGFDLTQESGIIDWNEQQVSFLNLFKSRWVEIQACATTISQAQSVQDDIDLLFEVDYLISENSLATVFRLTNVPNMVIGFENFLSLNQIGDSHQVNTFNNIIKLHQIAFRYYDMLKKDKRFSSIVFKPHFYP